MCHVPTRMLTKASLCRRLLAASHDGVRTEHGRITPGHTRPWCTQICGKLAEKDSSLGLGTLYTQRFSPPPHHQAPAHHPDRPCHTDKRITFANWVCAMALYCYAHLTVSCGQGEHPFAHSHHVGDIQNSSMGVKKAVQH